MFTLLVPNIAATHRLRALNATAHLNRRFGHRSLYRAPFISLHPHLPSRPLTPPSRRFLPTGTLKERETHIRESWIKAMEARIVRAELQKCYRLEGVNNYENCHDLAEKYTSMIRENKVGAMQASCGCLSACESALAGGPGQWLTRPGQGLQDHRRGVDFCSNASTPDKLVTDGGPPPSSNHHAMRWGGEHR